MEAKQSSRLLTSIFQGAGFSELGMVSPEFCRQIFYYISPLMIHEASDLQIRQSLTEIVRNIELPRLKNTKDGKDQIFRDFTINDEDFQTIKVQLRALGLINKNDKNRSVKDTKTYWTLTPYGDSVMNRLRAIEKSDG